MRILSILSVWGLLLMAISCATQPKPDPPNIVLFLVDDMGWQDTSVPFWTEPTPFNNRYRTPNMERLAKEGMKFTQAYATCVCSPTRISLMTGMNAACHRVTNWTLHRNQPSDRKGGDIQPPDWNMNGLCLEPGIERTVQAHSLPQMLKRGGYTSIHVGKAHFAATETPCAEPLNCGFDVNIGGHAAGAPGSYQGTDNFGNLPDGSRKNRWSVPGLAQYHGQEINLTEALTREALRTLDSVRTQKQPFYLYLSHYTVHSPIQPDPRFYQAYLDQGLDSIEARYASMIEGMDKSLGDVMDYLAQHNLSDNTVILFMSDNGGLSAVARGGEAHTHNWPLASGKGAAYEGGIREPMLVKWPGVVAPGSVCDDYLIIEDFFPTLLEIAQIENRSTHQTLDGISFVPMLKQTGNPAQGRPLFWHYPNIWGPVGPGIGPSSTVRLDDWKLIYFHADQRLELYQISEDISEQHNLVQSQSQKARAMAKILTDYLKSVEAQMPTHIQTGEVIPYPSMIL